MSEPHEAWPDSRFDRDIGKLDEMVDYLECILMYPENNPIKKKDIVKMCHRIRNMADHIEKETKTAGYAYFEEKAPEGYRALY